MPTILLPDVEALLVAYLRGATAISALVSTRVSTELPAEPVFPCITLSRIGGTPDKPTWADHASIQLDSWGRTKTEASNLARTAFDVVMQVPQQHALGIVTDSSPSLGITWAPDDTYEPPKPRYVQGWIITTHPQ